MTSLGSWIPIIYITVIDDLGTRFLTVHVIGSLEEGGTSISLWLERKD